MTIHQYLEQMNSYVAAVDWPGPEAGFRRLAEKLAGKETAGRISRIDLTAYERQLKKGLAAAIKKAKAAKAQAIYFEYDLDSDWAGTFFICRNYRSLAQGDDDWASDWNVDLDGPDCAALAGLYDPRFGKTSRAKGTNLYLIARTVAAFGRCAEDLNLDNMALCMAFHDQDPLLRIRERIS